MFGAVWPDRRATPCFSLFLSGPDGGMGAVGGGFAPVEQGTGLPQNGNLWEQDGNHAPDIGQVQPIPLSRKSP